MAVRQSPHRTPEELRMKLFNFAAIIGLEKIDEVNRYKTKSHFHFPYQVRQTFYLHIMPIKLMYNLVIVCVWLYVCVCIYIYIYVCACVCVCVCDYPYLFM